MADEQDSTLRLLRLFLAARAGNNRPAGRTRVGPGGLIGRRTRARDNCFFHNSTKSSKIVP
jgi:hypothetical protein